MQSRSSTDVTGIDVSFYQGTIDWNQVKEAGIQFVYVKATEGATYTDPHFAANVTGANGAGLPVGAYHFAQPAQTAAVDEAQHFVARLQSVQTQLMPVLDLEAPADPSQISVQALIDWVRTWISYVQEATGKQVMIYTGNWFVRLYNELDYAFADVPLWIANYGVSAPPDVGGWTRWTAWQYTDQGVVPGISGNVDMDVAVSLDALKGSELMQRVKVEINGSPITDGVVVGNDTYIVWTALGNVAGSVQAEPIPGGWNFITQNPPEPTPPPLDKEAAQKIITLLGDTYAITQDPQIQQAAHLAANTLRRAAGIPLQD